MNSKQHVFHVPTQVSDYTISSFLGLSSSVVSVLFFTLIASLQIARIQLPALLQGNVVFAGDPSVFYFAIFLVAATMLLVIQHHASTVNSDDQERLPSDQQ